MEPILNPHKQNPAPPPSRETNKIVSLEKTMQNSWAKIAPSWPLKKLIAVNPLLGLEHLPFEEALIEGAACFQQETIPRPMEEINRETIKWIQAFFDEQQATISMPLRANGFYAAWRKLAPFDNRLHENDPFKKKLLKTLPVSADMLIAECLLKLGIAQADQEKFITALLTTLPGWASYIKYSTEWAGNQTPSLHPTAQTDYLAVRIAITFFLWPSAHELIDWNNKACTLAKQKPSPLHEIVKAEKDYIKTLIDKLTSPNISLHEQAQKPDVQFIFCIDTRSEPFRRALEKNKHYETFGFSGFFGVPITIEDETTGASYSSCPVILQPKHTIKMQSSIHASQKKFSKYMHLIEFKKQYLSLKYTFTAPFALLETLGLASAFWMALRNFAPATSLRLKKHFAGINEHTQSNVTGLDTIDFSDQCTYAEEMLRMIGLIRNFAPLVVLCGHESTTENNPHASALNCGACGGQNGSNNARILEKILNDPMVRKHLENKNILIPQKTHFIAAEHNTTTDKIFFYEDEITDTKITKKMQLLRPNLESARTINSTWRCKQMGHKCGGKTSAARTTLCSQDWAQVRPEWGLAQNASFIVAPRNLTKSVDLEGRSFLHSYDWSTDQDGALLTTILTAPMMVAYWINTQYLFSTLDNVAYGSGSKTTQNITGKFGVMQGNASDLMHGLPLQSVYATDTQPYHQQLRLMTVVYAPRKMLDAILNKQEQLKKLFCNGWLTAVCIEPEENRAYFLKRDLSWRSEKKL